MARTELTNRASGLRERVGHQLHALLQRCTNGLNKMGLYEKHLPTSDVPIIRHVRHATMTSTQKLQTLLAVVEYVARSRIDGDIVECGVWRGGSMMAVALKLLELGETNRKLHLFDVFSGLPEPGPKDLDVFGTPASAEWSQRNRGDFVEWCYSPLPEVRRNMESTGYDPSRITYIDGKVEDTLPGQAPERIALLRLDTDWYSSTYHELVHLYPRVVKGGVIIVDDYNFWQGATDATNQYLSENGLKIFLQPLGPIGVLAVKPD